MKRIVYLSLLSCLYIGCEQEENGFDASGTFEAKETIISSEASGILLHFDIEEGEELMEGEVIGLVDTTQLFLKRKQLMAQILAIGSRSPDVAAQTSFYDEQLSLNETRLANLKIEQRRLEQLIADQAAPRKQLDDINAKVSEIERQRDVIEKQKIAQVSALRTQSSSVDKEPLPLYAQIEQIDDQLSKCKISNPISGTVLTKYAETREMTSMGKPLYKIGDLANMILRAYITGDQLPNVELNQEVTVLTDDGEGGYHEDKGQITWINDKAEFTPKTIQTKNERSNLVYAIKVKVANDGRYKIGMYGEIKL